MAEGEEMPVTCPKCRGRGYIGFQHDGPCKMCDGKGSMAVQRAIDEIYEMVESLNEWKEFQRGWDGT